MPSARAVLLAFAGWKCLIIRWSLIGVKIEVELGILERGIVEGKDLGARSILLDQRNFLDIRCDLEDASFVMAGVES